MEYFKHPELKDINNNKEIKSKSLGLSDSWFQNSNLLKISFDFFYNWKTKKIEKEIFIKKIFKSEIEQNIFFENFFNNKEKLKNDLIKEFSKYEVLNKYLFNVNILILNDYEEEPKTVLFNKKEFRFISFNEIQDKIREYTGKEFPIGKKGLVYSCTNLERKLSKTKTLYPGDVDLVTFDNKGFILSIFEYQKKLDGNYIFFKDLYANNQKLKYERLIALQNHISEINLLNNRTEAGFNIIHYSHKNSVIVESIHTKHDTNRKEFKDKHFFNKQFLDYLSYGFSSLKYKKISKNFKKNKIAIINYDNIISDDNINTLKNKIDKNECIIFIGKHKESIDNYCIEKNKQLFLFNDNKIILENLNLLAEEIIVIQENKLISNKQDKYKDNRIKLKSF